MTDPIQPVPAPSDSKKPWQSKTIIIASILGLVSALVPFIPGLHVVSDFINAHGAEIGSGWAVLAVALRFITKDAITLGD